MQNPTHTQGQASAARAAALESNTDNFSVPGTDDRWMKLEWLRRESHLQRQRICMTRAHAMAPVVSVKRGADSMGYGGLMACGKRTCPVCSPNLYKANREGIQQAIHAWREGEGGVVLFGTFTVRHSRRNSFAEMSAAVSKGWHAVTSGRGWGDDRRSYGVEHWVRVFEEKYSPETGWHLHLHYLMFLARGANEQTVAPLLRSMWLRWNRGLKKAGRDSTLQAQDLRLMSSAENVPENMARYFAKQTAETKGKSAVELAMELTLRDGKFGGDSFTPGELLTLAVHDLRDGRRLWAEYEKGMHKRRVIGWSKGLREQVGIGDEISDADLAALGDAELKRTVMQLTARAFRAVTLTGRRRELLKRAWVDPAAAVEWLASVGVDSVEGMFDRQGRETDQYTPFEGDLPF